MHRWAEDGTTCLKHRKFPSQIRLHHRLQQADLSAKLLMHETAISQDNVNLIWHSSDYCLINVTLAQARCISRSVSMEKLLEAQLARTFSIFLCNFLAIKYLFLMRFYCFWHVASERAITPTPSTVGTTSHPDTHLCATHSPTDEKNSIYADDSWDYIAKAARPWVPFAKLLAKCTDTGSRWCFAKWLTAQQPKRLNECWCFS